MEHIIWSNFDVNVADYADFLQEEYPEVTDPDEQYELCCEMNYAYLDDEKANLDMELPNGLSPDDYTDAMLRRQIADNPPEDDTEEEEG